MTVRFAFAELSPHNRIKLLNGLLVQLSADQVSVAINDPECLGLVAEARLIGLARSEELARYITASELRRLGSLVSEALLKRLPHVAAMSIRYSRTSKRD
jgi:hypothetical protein